MKCASSDGSTGNDDLINGTETTISINAGGGGGSSRTGDCHGKDIFIPAFQATVSGGNISDIQLWCDNIDDSEPTDNDRTAPDCNNDGSCGTNTGTNTLVKCTKGLGITKIKVSSGTYVTGIQIRCGSASTP